MKRVISVLFMLILSVSVLAGCDRPFNTEVNDGREMLTDAAASVAVAKAPTAEQFVKGYFDVIAGIEQGTAGASLKEARAAVKAFTFAQEYKIDSADYQTMRDNMLAGWETMTAEEQQDFDNSFISVIELLKGVTADNIPAVFEDAGVADELKTQLSKKNAVENWETLYSNTLTMGNSEE